MPLSNHESLGEVSKTVYLGGKILELFHEGGDVSPELWDTARVEFSSQYSPSGEVWEGAPIYYHCHGEVPIRENGSLVGAADAFDLGDEVVLRCTLNPSSSTTLPGGGVSQFSSVVVVAHIDLPRLCKPGWCFTFCGVLAPEGDSEGGPEGDSEGEPEQRTPSWYVTGYNAKAKRALNEIVRVDASSPDDTYEFPCAADDFLPWIDLNLVAPVATPEEIAASPSHPALFYLWGDDALYDSIEIDIDTILQVAGGTPNWHEDFSGDIIRGGTPAIEWWSTFDFRGNPTFNHFWDIQLMSLVAHNDIAEGDFSRPLQIADKFSSYGWDGPGVVLDDRVFNIDGTMGLSVAEGRSLHQQVAYGENEIWTCGRNMFNGMIISLCNNSWKYVRLTAFPPVIARDMPATKRLAEGRSGSSPLGSGVIGVIGDALQSLAEQTVSAIPHNTILISCALKRLNEGCFHYDSYPRSSGSRLLFTKKIPGRADLALLPTFYSTLDLRKVHFDTWVRFDNWHNTLQYSFAMGEGNRFWWARVWSTQTSWENHYIDSPIGSMMQKAPEMRSVLWQSFGLAHGEVTALKDTPISDSMYFGGRQNEKACAQVYVSYRQGLRADGYHREKADGWFFIQHQGVSPWDCLPSLSDLSSYEPDVPVADPDLEVHPPLSQREDFDHYVNFVDIAGARRHIGTLSEEEIHLLSGDLVFLNSKSLSPPNALRSDRREFEVIASVDTWGSLFGQTSAYNPFKQTRDGDFEQSICDLLALAIDDGNFDVFPVLRILRHDEDFDFGFKGLQIKVEMRML